MASATTELPDYYGILNVSLKATQKEIRDAYRKESLKTHPDRLPTNASAAEKKKATEQFQLVADAYYILSDSTQRAQYDTLRSAQGTRQRATDPGVSANFFANFASFANLFNRASANASSGAGTGAGAGTEAGAGTAEPQRPDAERLFGDVFEDLLRPEVERVIPFWTWLGAIFGAGLGFIVANIPGLLFGGYAGKSLGAIRDAKGKSVAAVFSQLGGNQKAEILRVLAMKVLGTTSTL